MHTILKTSGADDKLPWKNSRKTLSGGGGVSTLSPLCVRGFINTVENQAKRLRYSRTSPCRDAFFKESLLGSQFHQYILHLTHLGCLKSSIFFMALLFFL